MLGVSLLRKTVFDQLHTSILPITGLDAYLTLTAAEFAAAAVL